MKTKYEKPYIELIKCENNQLILSSKWPRYTFMKKGDPSQDYYSDEKPSYDDIKKMKDNGWNIWDNEGHSYLSKKNNFSE